MAYNYMSGYQPIGLGIGQSNPYDSFNPYSPLAGFNQDSSYPSFNQFQDYSQESQQQPSYQVPDTTSATTSLNTDNSNFPPAPNQTLYNVDTGQPFRTQANVLASPFVGGPSGAISGAGNTINSAINQSRNFANSSLWNQFSHNPDGSFNFSNLGTLGNLGLGIGGLGLGFAQYNAMKNAADRAYNMQKRQEARNVNLTNTQIRDRANSRAMADPSNASRYQQWGRDNQIK